MSGADASHSGTPFAYGPAYPFHSRFVTVAGHRMHYVDEGNGPVVVCLHGNPTWGFLFRNIVAGLRQIA